MERKRQMRDLLIHRHILSCTRELKAGRKQLGIGDDECACTPQEQGPCRLKMGQVGRDKRRRLLGHPSKRGGVVVTFASRCGGVQPRKDASLGCPRVNCSCHGQIEQFN
jgi:hypothetical protein